jgi:hypothetical protein
MVFIIFASPELPHIVGAIAFFFGSKVVSVSYSTFKCL